MNSQEAFSPVLQSIEHLFGQGGASGAALLVLRTFTGPFSKVEGLFTVLICIACLVS